MENSFLPAELGLQLVKRRNQSPQNQVSFWGVGMTFSHLYNSIQFPLLLKLGLVAAFGVTRRKPLVEGEV
jgi:hypothetical protein